MGDSRTFWLIVTNIAVGVLVLLAILGVITGVLCEIVAKWKKRRSIFTELDRDVQHFFETSRSRK